MKTICQRALLAAMVLSPALSFAQNIFIDAPTEGETIYGPTMTLRMSVSSDFELGTDGRILIRVDGVPVMETAALRATVALSPGTHEVEARLVDRKSRPIQTSQPEQVKVTMHNWSYWRYY